MAHLWKFTSELFIPAPYETALAADGIAVRPRRYPAPMGRSDKQVLQEAQLTAPMQEWKQTGGKQGKTPNTSATCWPKCNSYNAPIRQRMVDTAPIWSLLETVNDPEVPVLSVIDLGIIRDVQITAGSDERASPSRSP